MPLYLVGTPIGNLEDITLRALRTLQEVSLIAAEDTRTTRKLLKHFDIDAHLTSYHNYSTPEKLNQLIKQLAMSDIALVGLIDHVPGDLTVWHLRIKFADCRIDCP